MMNKLNYLLVLGVIFLTSCATNEDSLNKISIDRAQEVGFDLTEFQTQFPNEYDLLDFDALETGEMEIQDGDENRTVPMTIIPVVEKGTVLGYAGEFDNALFYSIIEKNRLINTDLATGLAVSHPIIIVKGEQKLDVENSTPINFVTPGNNSEEKGWCEFWCNSGYAACFTACTTVVVVGTAAATGASIPTTLGTAAPAVLIGAGAAQVACVAACVVILDNCLEGC